MVKDRYDKIEWPSPKSPKQNGIDLVIAGLQAGN